MKKKALFSSEEENNELSELLTRERLRSSNIKTPNISAKQDPDLAALFERVRSAKAKTSRKGVSTRQIRKLAGLK